MDIELPAVKPDAELEVEDLPPSTVEYLDYRTIEENGWDIEDDDLLEKAAVELPREVAPDGLSHRDELRSGFGPHFRSDLLEGRTVAARRSIVPEDRRQLPTVLGRQPWFVSS